MRDLTPCNSSFIAGHHYDADKRELTIEFKEKGNRQVYLDVPIEKADAFAGNISKGAYFGKKIRGIHASRSA